MLTYILSFSGSIIIFFLVQYLVRKERKNNKLYPFTEPFLRTPGYTLNKMLDEFQDELFVYGLMTVLPPVFITLLLNRGESSIDLFYYVVLITFTFYGAYRIAVLYKKAQPTKLGYFGELYTGQELNYLMRQGAYVYHDIPYKYGNIDHIIVSRAGVFTVETKAVRKPVSKEGKKEAKVSISNRALKFPHVATTAPIKQAQLHAQTLRSKLMINDIPVTPVVALPGWYIDGKNTIDDVIVINPQRGKFLEGLVSKEAISQKDFEIINKQIEEMARNIDNHKSITDADADRNYDLMLNRKDKQ